MVPRNDVSVCYVLNGVRFPVILFNGRKDEIENAYTEHQLTFCEAQTLLTRREREKLEDLAKEIIVIE